MTLEWVTFDAHSGEQIEELPGAVLKSSMLHHIGRGEGVTVDLPYADRFPDRWQTAIQPVRTVLACLDGDIVWWAGLIDGYSQSPTGVSVAASSAEQILERSFLPTPQTIKQQSQTAMLANLGLHWLAEHFNGRVEIGATETLRDKTYSNEDKTRLSAMQDFMGIIGGPEFCTRWEIKADGRLGIVGIAADRLGLDSHADTPIEVVLTPDDWTLDVDYSSGKGATVVTASTTKEADAGNVDTDGTTTQERITATVRAEHLLDAGWLPLEERFTPETGSKNDEIITEYAEGRLEARQNGTRTLKIKCLIEQFPWQMLRLGDDIEVDLDTPAIGEKWTARCRLLGWAIDADYPSGDLTHVEPSLALLEVIPVDY